MKTWKMWKTTHLKLGEIDLERQADDESPKLLIRHRGEETELIDYLINHCDQ